MIYNINRINLGEACHKKTIKISKSQAGVQILNHICELSLEGILDQASDDEHYFLYI